MRALTTKKTTNADLTWNLDNPGDLARRRLNYPALTEERQRELDPELVRVDEAMYSTQARIEYAKYHHFEAVRLQRLRKRRIQRSPSPEVAKMMYQVEHPQDRVASAANLAACLQNTHAIFDLFMFGAYYAIFVGDAAPLLTPRRVTWTNVEPLLAKRPELATLRDLFKALRANKDFEYLDALVNSSKHRAVIKAKHYIVIDYVPDEESPPRFDEFDFNDLTHPRREALPFTASTCNLMSKFIVEAGKELDSVLTGYCPS